MDNDYKQVKVFGYLLMCEEAALAQSFRSLLVQDGIVTTFGKELWKVFPKTKNFSISQLYGLSYAKIFSQCENKTFDEKL